MTHKPRPDQQEYDLEPLTRVRQAIGERTVTSFSTKPHFGTCVQVDASELVALRDELKSGSMDPLPTYNDLLLKVVASLLTKHRRLNAWLDAEGLKLLKHVNVAFAVATDQGVLLPVILDADQKPLSEVAAETRWMIEMARAAKLRASLQMGAGFTLSNIGPGRVEWFTTIISPPQVAILSVGSMTQRALVVDEHAVARPSFQAILTVDHQALDGADSAAAMNDFVAILENREALRKATNLR